jgi:hypothetical protein
VDNIKLSLSSTSPIISDQSEHDAQFLTVNNTVAVTNNVHLK